MEGNGGFCQKEIQRSTPHNHRQLVGAFVSSKKTTRNLPSSAALLTPYRDYRHSTAISRLSRQPTLPRRRRPRRLLPPPAQGFPSRPHARPPLPHSPRWRHRLTPPRPPRTPRRPRRGLTWASMEPAGPCPAPGAPWAWPGPACPGPGGVWVWLGRVKSVNSNSEPCVSAPSSSASSVSRKVRVCELGPYASTLMAAAVEKRSGASARPPHLGRAAPHGARAPRYASGGIRRAHQAAPPRTGRQRDPRCPARAAPNAAEPTAEGNGAGGGNREPRDAARGTVRLPPRAWAKSGDAERTADASTPRARGRVTQHAHTWEGTAGGGGAPRGRREGARDTAHARSEARTT